MARPLFVIGHKNPDTDSIVAAIALATLLRHQRSEDVIAARAGVLRPETSYLLERFGLPTPALVDDVRLRVGDVMTSPCRTVHERHSLYEVGLRQLDFGMRPLPVVDDAGRLRGMAEAHDFAQVFFQGLDQSGADEVPIDLDILARALDARVLVRASERTIRRAVVVAASSLESIRARLTPGMVLVVGDRPEVMRAAIESGVGMLVVTGGTAVPDEIAALAEVGGVTLVTVEHHTAATLRLIHMSVPVSLIMRRNPPHVHPDDLIDDVRDVLSTERALSVVDDDQRVIAVVTRADVLRAERRRVVLVDHNERGQAIDGIDQAEIVGVVDHHRVADLVTSQPPMMRFEPVGACSTLVAKLFAEGGVEVPPPVAAALVGAIVADTLLFQSPTTTSEDRRIAAWLADIGGVDPIELGGQMLAIASDVSHRSARDLVQGDFKSFALDGLRFGVGVIETGDAGAVLNRRSELLDDMRSLRSEGFASVLLVVTDVVRARTTILVEGFAEQVARAFETDLRNGDHLELEGVVSRKKQVVPVLARVRDLIAAPRT